MTLANGCQHCEIERLRAALGQVKARVCGDAFPNWENTPNTTFSRSYIADVCDLALSGDSSADVLRTDDDPLKPPAIETQPASNQLSQICSCTWVEGLWEPGIDCPVHPRPAGSKERFRKVESNIPWRLVPCRLCGSPAELWQRWRRDDVWDSFGACTNLEDVDGEACLFHLPDDPHFYRDRKTDAVRHWNLMMGPRTGDSSAPETSPNPFDHAAIMGDPGNRRISMSFEKREQYEAAIEFLGMGDSPVETKPKPTIEGLERLLQAEDSKQVYVWPDGYVHDTPPPEKAPEAHIDYNVPGCDCLGCELAPKTLVEVRAFGTSIDPPSQKALAPRYELPLEWQAREWTEIDSPSSLCGLLGCNRQTPHHHKAAL